MSESYEERLLENQDEENISISDNSDGTSNGDDANNEPNIDIDSIESSTKQDDPSRTGELLIALSLLALQSRCETR